MKTTHRNGYRSNCLQGFNFSILLIAILFTSPAFGELSAAVKLGRIDVGIPSASDPDNIGLMLSYEFNTLMADLSMAGEFTRTFNEGKSANGDKLEFESNALYLIFKTPGTIYVTLRGGVAETETISGGSAIKDSGFSAGGGFGVVVGRTRWQIEYTVFNDDTNFLSLGVEYD